MATISNAGAGLPSAASLFATNPQPTVTPAPVSMTPMPGPTVSGPGGTTTLPSAAPADFQGVNPTALDAPHPQFPGLIQSHVAVLQAIGTPEAVIAQLNATRPSADYLDNYIQAEIMQNPEGWDDFVGNPRGTARLGLQRLLPGAQLPGVGQGSPGQTGGVTFPNAPTWSTSGTAPSMASEGEGLIKGLVIGAVVVGAGLLAWKFLKNKKVAGDVVENATKLQGDKVLDGLKGLGEKLGKLDLGDDAAKVVKTASLEAFSKGGAPAAATVESIMLGLGSANGHLNAAATSAAVGKIPIKEALQSAKDFRWLDIMEEATKTGQLGEFAAASITAHTTLGISPQVVGAAAGAGGNAALQSALQSALNALT